MKHHQSGTLSLFWVAVFSAVLALLAMGALFSMRNERNLFAEGWVKLASAAPARQAVAKARKAIGEAGPGAATAGSGVLRRCVIDGKTVLSDTECTERNPTTRVVKALDKVGFDAPKVAAPEEAKPKAAAAPLEQVIDKQLR